MTDDDADELWREASRRVAERQEREEFGSFSWADWTNDRAVRYEVCTRWGRTTGQT